MEARRGRSKWREIPFSLKLGRIGLQHHEVERGVSDEEQDQYTRRDDLRLEQRQDEGVATKTILNIVVQDAQGNTIGRTTLDSIPTAEATLSFPFGQVTLNDPTLTASETSSPASPSNSGYSMNAPSSSSSLSIEIPGSSSQIVLSPPPTPNPSPTSSSPLETLTPVPPPFTGSNNSSLASTPTPSSIVPSSASLGLNSTSSSILSSSQLSSQTQLVPVSSFTTRISSSTNSTSSTFLASTGSFSSSATLISSSSSATASGLVATATDDAAGGPAATNSEAPPAASTTAAAAGGASPVNVPVVGGVVGGLAGFALILVLILFLLRWRKRKMAGARQLSSSADTEGARTDTAGGSGAMTQRPSSGWGAAGITPLFKKVRPYSQTTTTTAETAPSERGFQKISGRKLESVLLSGGDGYGDKTPAATGTQDRNMSGSSFYRDSHGTYGGPTSAGTSMHVGPASTRISGAPSSNYDPPGSPAPELPDRGASASPPDASILSSSPDAIVMRPGPARQPVHQPGFSNTRPGAPGTPPAGLSPVPPRVRQDGIGRSHASMDGSRDSRGSRFAEDFT